MCNRKLKIIYIYGGYVIMEFKKCERCGCFFLSANNVCENCSPKDNFELSKLRNYLEGEFQADSINSLSVDTGISVKNLNRYLEEDEFSSISEKLNMGNINL
jgi:hypothetical protein